MKELVVVKIGGSVITDKESTAYTIKTATLRAIFTEIAKVLEKNTDLQIILVHGAGGHIHHLAHTFDLTTGTGNNAKKKIGALQTHSAVERLNADVIKIGSECSLQLIGIPTDTTVTQTNKNISNFLLDNIENILFQNGIPVLCGDMVPDTELGMSICSGDAIAAHLSTQLPVTKILFATDVDGIYTDDPHINKDAKLVESLTLSEIKNITLRGSHNTDTTDGLRGKIAACTELFTHSNTLTEIHVFNGEQSENYSKVLQNSSFRHSCITK